jgi:hypothetical protein
MVLPQALGASAQSKDTTTIRILIMAEKDELLARRDEIEIALREAWRPESARVELRNEWDHIMARMEELIKEEGKHETKD